MLIVFLFLTISLLSAVVPFKVQGVVDPLDQPNNTFGIHIMDESDIPIAAELVNSEGGRWGYVTVVIRDNDRDREKWQRIFDQLRREQLIPLVRLATRSEGGVWARPKEHEVASWVGFLHSLNWVTQNRYVILFNEPNHAKEWGGEIRPDEYARIAASFQQHLKRASEDFFVIPAGFDGAASSVPGTMSSQKYFDMMYEEDESIFEIFDGWSSHSYPNPAFSGSPHDTGKQSIRGYQWELDYLSRYGLPKDIPVFITETGWVHREGKRVNRAYHSTEQVARFFETAFTEVWTDKNIAAITPFVLSYPEIPFDHFSWKKVDGTGFHLHFEAVRQLPKVSGEPVQMQQGVYVPGYLPRFLLAAHAYEVDIAFENTGQSIWNADEISLNIASTLPQDPEVIAATTAEPGDTAVFTVLLRVPEDVQLGSQDILFQLQDENGTFGDLVVHTFRVEDKSNLPTRIQLWIDDLQQDGFNIVLHTLQKYFTLLPAPSQS